MDTKKLGAELGERLAKLRVLGSESAREAKILIGEIIKRDPKVKLPTILADPATQSWQKERGVTDGQLKTALTEARADLKPVVDPDEVKVPVKSRNRSASTAPKAAPAKGVPEVRGAPAVPGFVPNRTLDLL